MNSAITFLLLMFLAGGCFSKSFSVRDDLSAKWPSEVDQAIKAVDNRFIEKTKNGQAVYYWKTDKYLQNPLPEYLEEKNFNQMLSISNAEYQYALEKLLTKASFRRCPEKETVKFFKMLRGDGYRELPVVHLWELESGVYLLICHEGGTSGERSYTFFVVKNHKAVKIDDFSYPPDREQIKKTAEYINALKNK